MKTFLACLLALGACLAFVGAASAAPKLDKNPNLSVVQVECGDLGSFEVIISENGSAGFLADGSVVVPKRVQGEFSGTITTFDGNVFAGPTEPFEEGSRGKGFEDRLIECAFTQTFAESFILDAGTADFFGIPEEYIGTEVTFVGTAQGTVRVILPGAP